MGAVESNTHNKRCAAADSFNDGGMEAEPSSGSSEGHLRIDTPQAAVERKRSQSEYGNSIWLQVLYCTLLSYCTTLKKTILT
jgi:hypothetical protein